METLLIISALCSIGTFALVVGLVAVFILIATVHS